MCNKDNCPDCPNNPENNNQTEEIVSVEYSTDLLDTPIEPIENVNDMTEYVELEMRTWRTAYFTNPDNISMEPDDWVVVQVDRGLDIGSVVHSAVKGKEFDEMYKAEKIFTVLRVANEQDLQQLDQVIEKEKNATEKFQELVVKYPFEMKLIDTIYQFDGNKVTFFFTAEGRIDFRDFVRELAQVFRTRIELHQSTGRDEAKRLGGYGMCGNKYCCASFLKRFNQVTIKMAKDQNLSGNLSKISGPCGRLLCCLHFEEDFYAEMAKDYPTIGDEVWVEGKKMYVFRNDYYTKMVYLSSEDQSITTVHLDDFNKRKK